MWFGAVIRGDAGEALLDTYEAERRPIAEDLFRSVNAQVAIQFDFSPRGLAFTQHFAKYLLTKPEVTEHLWSELNGLVLKDDEPALIERGRARTVIAQPRSTLVEECDPPQLTDGELYMFFSLLFSAGSDTTRNAVAGGVLAGFIGLLGNGFFQTLFLESAPAPIRIIENVLIGPIMNARAIPMYNLALSGDDAEGMNAGIGPVFGPVVCQVVCHAWPLFNSRRPRTAGRSRTPYRDRR